MTNPLLFISRRKHGLLWKGIGRGEYPANGVMSNTLWKQRVDSVKAI